MTATLYNTSGEVAAVRPVRSGGAEHKVAFVSKAEEHIRATVTDALDCAFERGFVTALPPRAA